MSGFLHRLAGTVLRPQQRIHPLVGSIYAGHHLEPDIETPANETNAPQSSLLLPRESSPQERRAVSRGSLTEQDKNSVAARDERVQTSALELQDRHPEAAPPAHREHSDQSESVAEAQPYTPLLSASIVPRISETPADGLKFLYSAPELTVAQTNRDVLPSPSPGPTTHAMRSDRREPDEIQIHIGRIEVTAITQAPPSTPARSGRTAPTLAEYLHRRDGRTG